MSTCFCLGTMYNWAAACASINLNVWFSTRCYRFDCGDTKSFFLARRQKQLFLYVLLLQTFRWTARKAISIGPCKQMRAANERKLNSCRSERSNVGKVLRVNCCPALGKGKVIRLSTGKSLELIECRAFLVKRICCDAKEKQRRLIRNSLLSIVM